MAEIKITSDLLADLKEKAEKATPGPWVTCGELEGVSPKDIFARREKDISYHDWHIAQTTYAGTIDDAIYIAAANPQVVLALIDRLEKVSVARSLWRKRFKERGQTLHKERLWKERKIAEYKKLKRKLVFQERQLKYMAKLLSELCNNCLGCGLTECACPYPTIGCDKVRPEDWTRYVKSKCAKKCDSIK